MRRLLLLAVLVVLALVWQAPAWLLAQGVRERSGGVVDLRNPTGTIWHGQAGAVMGAKVAGERELTAGAVGWQLERVDWGRRSLVFSLRQVPAGPRPATVIVGAGRAGFAGSLRLPAAVARRVPLLARWNIDGDAIVESDALEWVEGEGLGNATASVIWRGARLAPPDFPAGFALGEVTARLTLENSAITVSARNSGGDIDVTGDGSSRAGTIKLQLRPRSAEFGASGAAVVAGATPGSPASPAQLAWLQSHTMGRTAQGFIIEAGWPGR